VKRTRIALCVPLAVLVLGGSGCSLQSLKDSNKRLKQSNDRLVSENNRLEGEISALEQQIAGLNLANDAPERVVASDPGKTMDSRDLLLADEGISIDETSQGIRVRVPDRVFFQLGQAKLSKKGQRVLDRVARLVNEYPSQLVRVDGHTDDTPIRKVRKLYPTNWELSSARACMVVRYLVDRGSVDVNRIFPAGFSYYRPVARGRSAGARKKNRRVEIMILNERTDAAL